MESCVLWLHFFFLHLRALSNLWGRYDLKTKKLQVFGLNNVISSHRIKINTSVESSYQYFHFSFLHQQNLSNLRGRYDPQTEKKYRFFPCNCTFSSSVIPLLKALIEIFLSVLTLTSSKQFMRTL